jgi:hypothetical protein
MFLLIHLPQSGFRSFKIYTPHVVCNLCFVAFSMGKAFLAGSSVIGLGGLCFYGLGLSNQVGAIDRAAYVYKNSSI